MNTKYLFYDPNSPLEFNGTIIATRPGALATDITTFYPEGGGQPGDGGHLIIAGKSHDVIRVCREGSLVWHYLDDGNLSVQAGTPVSGRVDVKLRRIYSGHHTALHLLNGLVFRLFKAKVTGAQIGQIRSRMDFQLSAASIEMKEVMQAACDEEVAKDAKVLIYSLSRQDALEADLIRTVNRTIPPGDTVRVVEIEGLDRQACGGTHLRRIGEIKKINLHKFKSKGRGNKRAEISVELIDPHR